MQYTQPTILNSYKAVETIQGSTNKGAPFLEDGNPPHDNSATQTAYEVDE